MAKSLYLSGVFLNDVLGNASFSANLYIALLVSGTEVSGSGYARAAVTNDGSHWPAASGSPRSKSNTLIITFTSATGSWGTPNQVAIMDALSGGNVLWSGSITSPAAVPLGTVVNFQPGALVVQES